MSYKGIRLTPLLSICSCNRVKLVLAVNGYVLKARGRDLLGKNFKKVVSTHLLLKSQSLLFF